MITHISSPGSHLPLKQITNFAFLHKSELFPNIKEILTKLRDIEKKLLRGTHALINCIEQEIKSSLKTISKIKRIAVHILTANSIYDEDDEIILSSQIRSGKQFNEKIINITESISNLFGFYDYENTPWKECNEIIFPLDRNVGRLFSIDLNTFKQSYACFAPQIGPMCHGCKLDEDKYFIHGGRLEESLGTTYILDMKEKKYEMKQVGPCKDLGGGQC